MKYPINTLPINTPYHHTLLTRTLFAHVVLTHPINTPHQHIRSLTPFPTYPFKMYPINPSHQNPYTSYISTHTFFLLQQPGYRSAKGQLVSSLLDPREGFLEFFNDMLWVIFAMFFLASILFIYQAFYLMSIGRTDGQIVLLYFDALTVAIPVTLMISLILSSMYSASKLEVLDIYVR